VSCRGAASLVMACDQLKKRASKWNSSYSFVRL
jgi:hypothetical protein